MPYVGPGTQNSPRVPMTNSTTPAPAPTPSTSSSSNTSSSSSSGSSSWFPGSGTILQGVTPGSGTVIGLTPGTGTTAAITQTPTPTPAYGSGVVAPGYTVANNRVVAATGAGVYMDTRGNLGSYATAPIGAVAPVGGGSFTDPLKAFNPNPLTGYITQNKQLFAAPVKVGEINESPAVIQARVQPSINAARNSYTTQLAAPVRNVNQEVVNQTKTVPTNNDLNASQIQETSFNKIMGLPGTVFNEVRDAGAAAKASYNIFQIPGVSTGNPFVDMLFPQNQINALTYNARIIGAGTGAEIDTLGRFAGEQIYYPYAAVANKQAKGEVPKGQTLEFNTGIIIANSVMGYQPTTKQGFQQGEAIAGTTGVLAANIAPYIIPGGQILGISKSALDVSQAKSLPEAGGAVVGGILLAGGMKVLGSGSKAIPLYINKGKTVYNLTEVAGESLSYESKVANVTGKVLSGIDKYGVPVAGAALVGMSAAPIYQAGISGDRATEKALTNEFKVMFGGYNAGGYIGGAIAAQAAKPVGNYVFKQTVLQGGGDITAPGFPKGLNQGKLDAAQSEKFLEAFNFAKKTVPGSLKPTREVNLYNQAAIQALPKGQRAEAVSIIEGAAAKNLGSKLQGSSIYSAYGIDIGRPSGDLDYAQASQNFVKDVFKGFQQAGISPKGTKPFFEVEQMPGLGAKAHTSFVSTRNGKVVYELVNAAETTGMYKAFYNQQNVGGVIDLPSTSFRKTPGDQSVLGLKYQLEENLFGGFMRGRAKDVSSVNAAMAQYGNVLKAQPIQPVKTNVFSNIFKAASGTPTTTPVPVKSEITFFIEKPLNEISFKDLVNRKPNNFVTKGKSLDDIFIKFERTIKLNEKTIKPEPAPTRIEDYVYGRGKKDYVPNVKDYIFTPTPTPKPYSPTPSPTPTISSIIYGTPTPSPSPSVYSPTPTPTPDVYTPTPSPTPSPKTPTPSPTPTPTPYVYPLQYYLPPLKAKKGVPFGGGGGGSGGKSVNREKKVYYNELEQIMNIFAGGSGTTKKRSGKRKR